jgi:hypothetical protein
LIHDPGLLFNARRKMDYLGHDESINGLMHQFLGSGSQDPQRSVIRVINFGIAAAVSASFHVRYGSNSLELLLVNPHPNYRICEVSSRCAIFDFTSRKPEPNRFLSFRKALSPHFHPHTKAGRTPPTHMQKISAGGRAQFHSDFSLLSSTQGD